MAEQQVPTWRDYSNQVATSRPESIPTPFAPGAKTMRHMQMDSDNAQHAASLAAQMSMHKDKMGLEDKKLAFSQMAWQMDYDLQKLQWEAAQAAVAQHNAAQGSVMGKLSAPLSKRENNVLSLAGQAATGLLPQPNLFPGSRAVNAITHTMRKLEQAKQTPIQGGTKQQAAPTWFR